MQGNRSHRMSWSDLPPEIIQSIPNFLYTTQDALNFRAVCRKWRRATQASAFLPCSITYSPIPQKVVSSSIYLVRNPRANSSQSEPWVVLSVEFVKGVTQFYNPFTRNQLHNLPSDMVLTQFSTTQLASECHIAGREEEGLRLFSSGSSSLYVKALIVFHPFDIPCIHNLCLLALFNGGFLREKHPHSRNSFQKSSDPLLHIDDMIKYKGKIYALDRNHKLYLCGKPVKGLDYCCVVANNYHSNKPASSLLRNRLVVSSSGDKLYMICPIIGDGRTSTKAIQVYFRVCELKYLDNSYCWNEVKSFGDVDQVLFVTRDYCFLVAASEFPGCHLRNCIVFSDDAFPRYSDSKCGWDYGSKVGSEVAIFCLEAKFQYSQSVRQYPGFPVKLWSPPPWAVHKLRAPSLPHLRRLLRLQREPKQPVQSCQDGASLQVRTQHEHASSSRPLPEKETIKTTPSGGKKTGTTAIDALKRLIKEGSHQGTLKEGTIHSVMRAYVTSINQSNNTGENSTVEFEGLNIRPSLVPTLQKIWSKHGNVVENCLMCNGEIVARAIESLATMVLILEDNSARSLSDDQANYLSSALSDLRTMRFEVEWLVPFVEKAVGLHKGKPLMDTFNKLSQLNDQATEHRAKLLDEIAKVDEMQKELKEDMANLSKMIPSYGENDLDLPLGGGLT